MSNEELINELIALENHFEEGRKLAYMTRSKLEQFSAPAPSGGHKNEKSRIVTMIDKRKKKIINQSK